MVATRILDAYCDVCEEMRPHVLSDDDPGSCTCSACGHVQQMYEPLEAGAATRTT